jgi:hypothetical protein
MLGFCRKVILQMAPNGRHTEVSSPYVSSTSRVQSSTAVWDCAESASWAYKSGRLDCYIEQQRAVYSRELTRDILFAARDYLRISRAATDATGASLTVWKEDQSGAVEILRR